MPQRNAVARRPVTTRPSSLPSATVRRDQRPQVNDVTTDELRRFDGGSALTQHMRAEMQRVNRRSVPDPNELGDLLRERDAEERARHEAATRRSRQEYDDYLASRPRNAPPVGDDENSDELEPAKVRLGSGRGNQRLVDQLEIEAQSQRQPRRLEPTYDRTDLPGNRESQLLTDDVDDEPEPSPLSAKRCTLADVDRLWDWIRQDADAGARFLGATMQTSQQLHTLMKTIASGEATRASVARAIYDGDAHIGFGVLLPVLIREKMAGLHLYLRADVRGSLTSLLPSLLAFAHDIMPGVRLAVMDGHPSMAGLLATQGFVMHTIFVEDK